MPPGVVSCQFLESPLSISFSGSGFMATYQLGVGQCFLNYAPWILKNAPRVFGASAGSLVAAAVVCEIDLVSIRDEMLNFAKQVKTFRLGPLNPSVNVFHWLEHVVRKYVTEDAHKLASGRLAVAMTRLEDGKHIITTEYHSKEDIVQALLCSCYVPGYCGMTPPSFKGEYYVDGGFTGMQPGQPQCRTLTVSPFSGDMDICPTDAPCLFEMVVTGTTLKANVPNSFRIFNALYPTTLESLEEAYDSGYKDANDFLFRNNLAPYMTVHDLPHPHLKAIEDGVKKPEMSLTTFTVDANKKSEGHNDDLVPSMMTLDFLENVLLRNVLINKTMERIPGKFFSFLLLPLLLVSVLVMQSWHRFQFWFWESPEWIFWTLAGFRHFTFFFYKICIGTMRKNIYDRVKHVMLMVQWLNIQVEVEALGGKWKSVHGAYSLSETKHQTFSTDS